MKRGRISEAEASLIKKLFSSGKYSVSELASNLERSEDSIKQLLGLETHKEPKRIYNYSFEHIKANLDRGECKFYLPKDLTMEDVEEIVASIYAHYGFEQFEFEEIEIPSNYESIRRAVYEEPLFDSD